MTTCVFSRPAYPFPRDFYESLIAKRPSFERLSSSVVQVNRGHGFRVEAGQVLRLTMLGGPQIIDASFLAAEDPREYCLPGTQLAIEGFAITRLTRLWGTPPRTRPLATCIADTVRTPPNDGYFHHHFCHTSYCSVHVRTLFRRTSSRNSCYDNLCEGLAMVGLGQEYVCDTLNLFMKGTVDPASGRVIAAKSDAIDGDYMEFYAETALFCILSLCPGGGGSDGTLLERKAVEPALQPVGVEIYWTDTPPLGWPY